MGQANSVADDDETYTHLSESSPEHMKRQQEAAHAAHGAKLQTSQDTGDPATDAFLKEEEATRADLASRAAFAAEALAVAVATAAITNTSTSSGSRSKSSAAAARAAAAPAVHPNTILATALGEQGPPAPAPTPEESEADGAWQTSPTRGADQVHSRGARGCRTPMPRGCRMPMPALPRLTRLRPPRLQRPGWMPRMAVPMICVLPKGSPHADDAAEIPECCRTGGCEEMPCPILEKSGHSLPPCCKKGGKKGAPKEVEHSHAEDGGHEHEHGGGHEHEHGGGHGHEHGGGHGHEHSSPAHAHEHSHSNGHADCCGEEEYAHEHGHKHRFRLPRLPCRGAHEHHHHEHHHSHLCAVPRLIKSTVKSAVTSKAMPSLVCPGPWKKHKTPAAGSGEQPFKDLSEVVVGGAMSASAALGQSKSPSKSELSHFDDMLSNGL